MAMCSCYSSKSLFCISGKIKDRTWSEVSELAETFECCKFFRTIIIKLVIDNVPTTGEATRSKSSQKESFRRDET